MRESSLEERTTIEPAVDRYPTIIRVVNQIRQHRRGNDRDFAGCCESIDGASIRRSL